MSTIRACCLKKVDFHPIFGPVMRWIALSILRSFGINESITPSCASITGCLPWRISHHDVEVIVGWQY